MSHYLYFLTYFVLHFRYSRDIARQPRDKYDARSHVHQTMTFKKWFNPSSSKGSKYLKILPQFSYLFNRNAFIWTVRRRSCSQTNFVVGFRAQNQWLNCSILPAYQNKPESTKLLIIFIIKKHSHYKVHE